MIITYTPADGEERRWDLKTVRILMPEAAAVEKVVGERWPQVKAAAMQGGAQALWAIAWVLMKRETPALRMTQWTPAEDELGVDFDAEERGLLREEAERNPNLTDEQREQVLAELDDPADEDQDEPEGKAPALPEAPAEDWANEPAPTAG